MENGGFVKLARVLGIVILPLWLAIFVVIAIGSTSLTPVVIFGIANLFVGLLVGWLLAWSPRKLDSRG